MASGPEVHEDGTKTCPECAERVQGAARVCRFCGHQLDGGAAEDQPTIGQNGSAKAKQERSFIAWGFITAIIFAPVGIFFGIRLLVRERVGAGLAVILVAVAVWGAGIVVVLAQHGTGPAAKHFSAHDSSVQHEVEQQIETSSKFGSPTGVSCIASSDSAMECLGEKEGSQHGFTVTVDTNTGNYIISGKP